MTRAQLARVNSKLELLAARGLQSFRSKRCAKSILRTQLQGSAFEQCRYLYGLRRCSACMRLDGTVQRTIASSLCCRLGLLEQAASLYQSEVAQDQARQLKVSWQLTSGCSELAQPYPRPARCDSFAAFAIQVRLGSAFWLPCRDWQHLIAAEQITNEHLFGSLSCSLTL